MTPEQLQQFGNSPMTWWLSMVPWWMKLGMLIQLGSQLACLICLPLIAWKLWRNNGPVQTAIKSSSLPPQVQERQARRDAIRKMTEPQSADEIPPPEISPESDNDSRYMPNP